MVFTVLNVGFRVEDLGFRKLFVALWGFSAQARCPPQEGLVSARRLAGGF